MVKSTSAFNQLAALRNGLRVEVPVRPES